MWMSCLGDNEEEVVYTPSTDAQLFTFKLTNDSISATLATVSYTIDQLTGEIYNQDSLAFGLIPKIAHRQKAIFTYTTAISEGGNVYLISENPDNPTLINSGDSIAIHPFVNNPQKYLRVYAMDGTSKEYTLNLRVHTVDPDSMVYERLSTELPELSTAKTVLWKGAFYRFGHSVALPATLQYTSSVDGATWSSPVNITAGVLPQSITVYKDTLYARTATGDLYSAADVTQWTPQLLGGSLAGGQVTAILGEIRYIPNVPQMINLLSLVVKSGDQSFFVKTDLHGIWIKGDETPQDFPTENFTTVSWVKANSFASNLTLVTGGSSNAVWRTQGDTLSGWAKLPAPQFAKGGSFGIPDGVTVFYYDDRLHLINGNDASKPVYTSIDGGLTWLKMENKYSPPAAYPSRRNASVCVKDRYIYIFGGESEVAAGIPSNLTDVWKAGLNKFGFEN
jgi:hypothetical protein